MEKSENITALTRAVMIIMNRLVKKGDFLDLEDLADSFERSYITAVSNFAELPVLNPKQFEFNRDLIQGLAVRISSGMPTADAAKAVASRGIKMTSKCHSLLKHVAEQQAM